MKIYHNEIDDRCSEVLERRFPDSVVDRRSIEDVQPEEIAQYRQCHFFAGIGGFSDAFRRAGLGADCNVWTGGFPCQDLSVAGKRAGLAGSRSGLYFHFQRLVAQSRPDIVLAENVPGLLSSNGGRDFAIVLGGFTGIIPGVPDGGWGSAGFLRGRVYSVAYRIFDAQYFGVAQRRRRVFIVASLGDGRCAEILFERESMPGDAPPSSKEEQGITSDVVQCAQRRGGYGWSEYDNLSPTLQAEGESHQGGPDKVPYIWEKRLIRNGRGKPEYICPPLKATSGGTGKGDSAPLVAFGISENQRAEVLLSETSHQLTTGGGKPGQGYGAVLTQSDVRRLTPTEYARLQGFSDDWNNWLSDSIRYRQFGNAVAVPNVEWIARRIAHHLQSPL